MFLEAPDSPAMVAQKLTKHRAGTVRACQLPGRHLQSPPISLLRRTFERSVFTKLGSDWKNL
jgi:hypothetical protein